MRSPSLRSIAWVDARKPCKCVRKVNRISGSTISGGSGTPFHNERRPASRPGYGQRLGGSCSPSMSGFDMSPPRNERSHHSVPEFGHTNPGCCEHPESDSWRIAQIHNAIGIHPCLAKGRYAIRDGQAATTRASWPRDQKVGASMQVLDYTDLALIACISTTE